VNDDAARAARAMRDGLRVERGDIAAACAPAMRLRVAHVDCAGKCRPGRRGAR
jgi:hypothetical protein